MNIQKLRLQKGWSQEELATVSGVSSRTIQRIEKGEKPSLETQKSLSAAFNVDFNQLQENEMQNENITVEQALKQNAEEKLAFEHVQVLRGFYQHAFIYCVVITGLWAVNLITRPEKIWAIYPMIGWGLGLIMHWLNAFPPKWFLGASWEKREVEKRLGRKI